MKIQYVYCILFLALIGQAQAQLTCTYCRVRGASTTSVPLVIADANNRTYGGSIVLTGNSDFAIIGSGYYFITGVISQMPGNSFGFTLSAPQGGDWGGVRSGLMMGGASANTYTGTTTINSGALLCTTPANVVAIPGDIVITAPPSSESLLRFSNDGQLSGNGKLTFASDIKNTLVILDGTTQKVRGIVANRNTAILENNEVGFPPQFSNPPRNAKATLIVTGGGEEYAFGSGAFLRAFSESDMTVNQGLDILVQGQSQIIQDPSETIHHVNIICKQGSYLRFFASPNTTSRLIESVVISNNGTFIKKGAGEMQLFKFIPTGDVKVEEGTLTLAGSSRLGNNDDYSAWLVISAGAVLNHNSSQTIFIMNNVSGEGTLLCSGSGKIIICGDAQKSFTGKIVVAGGGFFGGYYGDIGKAQSITVKGNGKIGAGEGVDDKGAYIIVPNLIFESSDAKLVATSITSSNNNPSTVAVQSGNGQGTVTANNGFTVDVVGGTNLVSGYIILCANGASGKIPIPKLGANNTGKNVCFKWDNTGLLMSLTTATAPLFNQPSDVVVFSGQPPPEIKFTSNASGDAAPAGYQWVQRGALADDVGVDDYTADWSKNAITNFRTVTPITTKQRSIEVRAIDKTLTCISSKVFTYTLKASTLTCDNCRFQKPDNTLVVGTPGSPAVILDSPATAFAGDIVLTGPCTMVAGGRGNFRLSGAISGTGPLTYSASDARFGPYENVYIVFSVGVALEGNTANTYSGTTSIFGGYVICNKTAGTTSIPGNIIMGGPKDLGSQACLWFLSDNQVYNRSLVEFQSTDYFSFFDLNCTTQTIGGLKANTYTALVENHWERHPVGVTNEQWGSTSGTLNIMGSATPCVFAGTGSLRNGYPTDPSTLTVNVVEGIQIIQDINQNQSIRDVTLATSPAGTLELRNSVADAIYLLGPRVRFRGAGKIKKTGAGKILTNSSTIVASGQIWVYEGLLLNGGADNAYTLGAESNTASLQVDAPSNDWDNHSPTFNINGNNSIFDGLTGGGFVENNWAAPGNGSWLTLGQNNSQNNPVFSGALRDYPANSSAGVSAGGLALKKVGTGTQALSGNNTYTGNTLVSSGTLKLQGNGLLGGAGNSYGGQLDISNVPVGSTPAVFEHNGDQIQVFSGDITNVAPNAVLGTFLQSGNGKSIIKRAINFTGNVRVTKGFLGGTGDLSKANSVRVEAQGSMGGGGLTEIDGATLIAANLSFEATAKLVVMPRSATDNNPSVVEVKTATGLSGTVTAATGFLVDVVGVNLISGYVIKCANGVSSSLPAPTTGINRTGKSVCFRWDAVGLWMQVSLGNITLTQAAGSICPKGVDSPLNPPVVITASYTDPRDYTTGVGDFSLSNTSVQGSPIVAKRVDNATVTATFSGANTTAADIAYTITYEDHQNCPVKLDTRIVQQPTLRILSGNASLCLGMPVTLQSTGSGALSIYDASGLTTLASRTTTSSTIIPTTIGPVKLWVVDENGCSSEYLYLSVLAPLTIDNQQDGKICAHTGGDTPNSIELTASDDPAPTNPWTITNGGANGKIDDNLPNDRKAIVSSINSRQADTKTVTVQFKSIHECVASFVVTVNPAVSLEFIQASKLCEYQYNMSLNPKAEIVVKYPFDHGYPADQPAGNWQFTDIDNPTAVVNPGVLSKATSLRHITGYFPGMVGHYEVRYVDNRTGCRANEYVTIRIESLAAPSVTSPISYCQNSTNAVPLTVNEPGAYRWWSPENDPPSTNAPTPSTAVTGESIYRVSRIKSYTALAETAVGIDPIGYTCNGAQATLIVSIVTIQISTTDLSSKLCAGELYDNLITKNFSPGTWSITDDGSTSNIPDTKVTTNGAGNGKLVAGLVDSDNAIVQNIRFQSSGCTSNTLQITINPAPKININPPLSFDANHGIKLCSGASYPDAVSVSRVTGNTWAIYKTKTTEAGATTISSSTTANSATIQAENTTIAVTEDLVFTSALSCSSRMPITIYPKPMMDPISNITVCGNTNVSAFTPTSPSGEVAPTHFKWKPADNAAHTDEVGFPDQTEWLPTISGFTAVSTNGELQRDIQASAYNSLTGCEAEPQRYSIIVKSGVTTLTYTASSPICNGSQTDIVCRSPMSNTKYRWTVSANTVGATDSQAETTTPTIIQTLTNNGNAPATVTYSVIGNAAASGACEGRVEIPIIVNPSTGVRPTIVGQTNSYCVNPEDNTCKINLIPSTSETTPVEWTYTSSIEGGGESTISGNTQKLEKGALSAVTDNLVLTGTEAVVVNYVFRSYSGCLGLPSEPIRVKIYPAPMAAEPVQSYVCSSSAANPMPTSITLTDISTPDVVYTWTADKTNAPNVTGYSQPSREGAIVGLQNPAAATTDPIADNLSLTGATPEEEATLGAQTFDYLITPWREGCPGNVVKGRVTVNPLPIVTPPANRIHCSGVSVETTRLQGINGANEFSWTGGNAVNLSDQPRFGSGNLPRYTTPTVNTPPTQVTIIARNPNGCISAPTSFTISVMPKPTLSPIAPHTLCTGATINRAATITIAITPNPAETIYTWTVSSRENSGTRRSQLNIIKDNFPIVLPYTEISDQTGDLSAMFTANDDDNTTVTFNLTPVSNGCLGNIAKVEVNVRGKDLLAYTSIDNMSEGICSGSATAIKVGKEGDGNIYSWKSVDNSKNIQAMDNSGNSIGLSDEHDKSATVISDILTLKDTKRGKITYFVTPSRDDCDGFITKYSVLINPVPKISVSPDKAFLCSGQKTDIILSSNLAEPESKDVVYTWQASDNTVGAQSSTGDPSDFEQQPLTNTNTAAGSVTYTFTPWYIPFDKKGSCQGQSGVAVYTVTASASARINEIAEKVCLGDNLTLKALPDDARYQWLKDGVEIAGEVSRSYAAPTDKETTSSYTVKTTNVCGSSTSDPKTVSVSADAYFTKGSATVDKLEEEVNKPMNFSYTGPEAEYTWDFNDNTSATTQNASHSYAKSATYHPTLKVIKAGQPACQKTFVLPDVNVKINNSSPSVSSAEFGVFPLPASSVLHIVNTEEMHTIAIYNLSGQLVANYVVNEQKVLLPVTHLASGIYFLIITNSNTSVKRLKITINHDK